MAQLEYCDLLLAQEADQPEEDPETRQKTQTTDQKPISSHLRLGCSVGLVERLAEAAQTPQQSLLQ